MISSRIIIMIIVISIIISSIIIMSIIIIVMCVCIYIYIYMITAGSANRVPHLTNRAPVCSVLMSSMLKVIFVLGASGLKQHL